MINEDLFDDPKDLEIVKLKLAIENFKKYDEERKKYYAKAMQRLGELEAFMEEIEDKDDNNVDLVAYAGKLQMRIKALEAQVSKLSCIVRASRIMETLGEEKAIAFVKDATIRGNYERKRKENKMLKRRIKDLIRKNNLQNQEVWLNLLTVLENSESTEQQEATSE